MNDTSYIGMRYVPVFADPSQWDISRQYENLMMVTNEGETYISKKFVPTGIELENTDYWVQISVPGGSTSGGVNYSTEEQDTGLKWIDGKPIFQKTYDINVTTQHDPLQITPHGLVDANFIGYEAFFVSSDGTILSPQYLNSGWRFYLEVTSQNIQWNNLHFAEGHYYVTLRYTKLSEVDESVHEITISPEPITMPVA